MIGKQTSRGKEGLRRVIKRQTNKEERNEGRRHEVERKAGRQEEAERDERVWYEE